MDEAPIFYVLKRGYGHACMKVVIAKSDPLLNIRVNFNRFKSSLFMTFLYLMLLFLYKHGGTNVIPNTLTVKLEKNVCKTQLS